MTDPWHSLYIPDSTASRTGRALTSALTALGYTAFDPFGLIPARPAPDSARAFIAPTPIEGWVRVFIGVMREEVIRALSVEHLLLSLRLEGEQALFEVWAGGAQGDIVPLLAYARPNTTRDALTRALNAEYSAAPMPGGDPSFSSLAAEAGALAGTLPGVKMGPVEAQQANRLFDKMMGGLRGKLNADDANAAHALLNAGPRWDSAGGARLNALAALLLPDTWRTPDYLTVRDAYALYRRRQALPNAKLYPGDAEALAAVPDAGDHLPIFYARG